MPITVQPTSNRCIVCSRYSGVGVVAMVVAEDSAPRREATVFLCERHAREAATELMAAANESMTRRVIEESKR